MVAGIGAGGLLLPRGSDAVVPASAHDGQKVVLHRAEERLVKRCMATAGFRYDEEPMPVPPIERRFPFLVDDVEWARTNGYGRPGEARPRAIAAYIDALPPERQRLYGPTLLGAGKQLSVELPGGQRLSASDQGCVATARRRLYGDLPRWFKARKTSDKLIYAVYPAVRADRRFSGAMEQWSACIREHGYPVEGRGELRALVNERTKGKSVDATRAAERDATVAEATCASTTGAGRTLRELEAEYLAKITAEHRRELDDLRVLEQEALPRAEAVLGEP